eukprot:4052010-Pyramimonas_sp.AAC.1
MWPRQRRACGDRPHAQPSASRTSGAGLFSASLTTAEKTRLSVWSPWIGALGNGMRGATI